MAGYEFGVSTRTLTVLVYIVSFVWSANLLAPLIVTGFAVNTGVNGVMGATIGLLAAARYQSRNKEQKKKAEDADDE